MKRRINLVCAIYMALIVCLSGLFGLLMYEQEKFIKGQNRYIAGLLNREPVVVIEYIQLPPRIVEKIIYVDKPVYKVVEIISEEQAGELKNKDATIEKLENLLDWKNRLLNFELGDNLPYDPPMSDGFDCDDRAVLNFLFLSGSGYEPEIIKGNLERDNESLVESNHVWVLAEADNVTYVYDYDIVKSEQYLEGHRISYERLLYWAMKDQ